MPGAGRNVRSGSGRSEVLGDQHTGAEERAQGRRAIGAEQRREQGGGRAAAGRVLLQAREEVAEARVLLAQRRGAQRTVDAVGADERPAGRPRQMLARTRLRDARGRCATRRGHAPRAPPRAAPSRGQVSARVGLAPQHAAGRDERAVHAQPVVLGGPRGPGVEHAHRSRSAAVGRRRSVSRRVGPGVEDGHRSRSAAGSRGGRSRAASASATFIGSATGRRGRRRGASRGRCRARSGGSPGRCGRVGTQSTRRGSRRARRRADDHVPSAAPATERRVQALRDAPGRGAQLGRPAGASVIGVR